MIDSVRRQLTDALADGDWHPWRELGELGNHNLGAELLIATELAAMCDEGLVLRRPMPPPATVNEYRMPPPC